MNRKTGATRLASKLLNQVGYDLDQVNPQKPSSCATDVEKIAEALDINIVPYPFSENISGVFFRKDNKLFLGVNSSHHIHRQRFTIAHEIGHFLLHATEALHYDKGPENEMFFRADNITNLDEIQANHFAAELLMPKEAVLKCIKEGAKSSQELSECFNVSEDAMRYRLVNIGLL